MIKDFAGSVLSKLESLFTEFNYRKLLFWVFILVISVAILITFENYTGYAYFSRMERKVAILKSLNELAKDDISSRTELNLIYQDTISELKSYKVETFSLSDFFSGFGIVIPQIPSEFRKFISGGFLGFMVAIAGLVDKRKGNEKWNSTFMSGLVFGISFGFIGAVIPTIYNIWVNHIGFPIVQIAGILLFSKISTKK